MSARPSRARPTRLARLGMMCWLGAGCAVSAGSGSPATPPPVASSGAGWRVQYCASTVTEWDVHRCLGLMGPDQRRRSGSVYRLTFDGERLVAFDSLNGRGRFLEEPTLPTSDQLSYDQRGQVVDVVRRDRNGVIRAHTRISADRTAVRWVDADGRPLVKKGTRASGLSRVVNAQGRVVAYRFVTADGVPTASASGVVQVRPRRDAQGVLQEEAYFDSQGAPAVDNEGVHRIVYNRDGWGLPTSEAYFGVDGGATTRTDGVHAILWTRDDVGNIVSADFEDLSGAPARAHDEGACGYRLTRDAFGAEVSRTYVDEAGRPVVSAFGYATRRKLLDDDGLAVEWAFFGVDGRPMLLHSREHAVLRRTLDARKRTIVESFLGVDGLPRTLPGGYQRVETAYDGRDNPRTITLQDRDGRAVNGRGGHAIRRQTFDGGDRLVRQTFFDADDRPTESRGSYAQIITRYDGGGDAHEQYLDRQGREQAPPPANAARAPASVACLPAPAVEQGTGRPRGKEPDEPPKDRTAMRKVLESGGDALRVCYEARLVKEPLAAGSVVARFSISPAGLVTASCVEGSSLGDPILDRCVADAIMTWRFPRAPDGKWTAVSYPIWFSPPP